MGKSVGKKGKGKNRLDKYYQLAKEQGYRSRAAFKLLQLNKRHDFLRSCNLGVIDLCAAPGGWMQVCRQLIPVHAPVIGVDIVTLKPIPNTLCIQHDITKQSCSSELKSALKSHYEALSIKNNEPLISKKDMKVDAVISDGSPNMGMAWIQDAYTQAELVLGSIRLATEFLAPKGTFIAKVFRSTDYHALLFVANKLFRKVFATKPIASRAESAEIYMVCTGFLAPKSIDMRLLDPKVVFKDLSSLQDEGEGIGEGINAGISENAAFQALLAGRKTKRKAADGYDTRSVLLHKTARVVDFVLTNSPIQLLSTVHQLVVDDKSSKLGESEESERENVCRKLVENEEVSNEEVRELWQDLKVLGRRDFKKLLKWRQSVRKLMEEVEIKSEEQEEQEEEDSEDEEMRGVMDDLGKKEKREKRRQNKIRAKNQRRVDMKMVLPDDEFDMPSEAGLFSLNGLQKRAEKLKKETKNGDSEMKKLLKNVEIDEIVQDDDDDAFVDDGVLHGDDKVGMKVRDDEEFEAVDAAEAIERQLDIMYEDYLERKGERIEKAKEKNEFGESSDDEEVGKEKSFKEVAAQQKYEVSSGSDSDDSSDDESERMDRENGEELTEEAKVWFNSPGFQQTLSLVMSNNGEKTENGNGQPKKKARKLEKKETLGSREAKVSVGSKARATESVKSEEPRFPVEKYTVDELAEIAAEARAIKLGGKRARQTFEDETFHRNAFDDPEGLPRWFLDEDTKCRQRVMPVTKDEVDAMKLRLRALEALPTKKEAEAKARHKLHKAKRMEQVRLRASAITNQGELSGQAKLRAVENLYKSSGVLKKRKSSPGKAYYVANADGTKRSVANRSKPPPKGSRTKLVDKRMLADKRGSKASAARKGKGKKQRR